MVQFGQLFNKAYVQLSIRSMGHTPGNIKSLTESQALQYGADVFGEMILFGIAVGIFYHEYSGNVEKEALKAEKLNAQFSTLQSQISTLASTVTTLQHQIREQQEAKERLETMLATVVTATKANSARQQRQLEQIQQVQNKQLHSNTQNSNNNNNNNTSNTNNNNSSQHGSSHHESETTTSSSPSSQGYFSSVWSWLFGSSTTTPTAPTAPTTQLHSISTTKHFAHIPASQPPVLVSDSHLISSSAS